MNPTNEHREPDPSPRPWRIHNTGSYLAIKDARGWTVIRKTTSQLTLEEFKQLRADFDLIVASINRRAQTIK